LEEGGPEGLVEAFEFLWPEFGAEVAVGGGEFCVSEEVADEDWVGDAGVAATGGVP
jgi:hypothetical protein